MASFNFLPFRRSSCGLPTTAWTCEGLISAVLDAVDPVVDVDAVDPVVVVAPPPLLGAVVVVPPPLPLGAVVVVPPPLLLGAVVVVPPPLFAAAGVTDADAVDADDVPPAFVAVAVNV
jgi:hypothetical protein